MFRKSDQLDAFSHFMYEQMVPATHKLRQFKAAVDLSMVDSLAFDSYSWNGKGTPSYDPTVLFHLLLLQRIYNLSRSEVLDRANTDAAFRWFVGINTSDELPSKATLSNFARLRMGNIKLRKVFQDVVEQARAKGMI
jgi:transposase